MRGDGYIAKNGYRYIHIDGKKIGQHTAFMMQILGRNLKRGEIVHHKNGNRSDNRLENLELMTVSKHLQMHNLKHPVINGMKICTKCGKNQPIKEFGKASYVKSGYRNICRTCKNIFQNKYYHRVKFQKPEMYGLDLSRLNHN